MSRLGVLRNPASSANRRARPLALPSDAILKTPPAPEAVDDAVGAMLAEGVRRIAVDGGDGTARLVIDAVLRQGAEAETAIILLRRGNTNLFCREIGGWKHPSPGSGDGHLVARRLLRVSGAGPVRHGLIMGLGAYEQATRLAAQRPGPLGGAGVALAIGRALLQALFEGPEGRWRRGTPLSIGFDGSEGRAGQRLLFAATVAEGRLPLGIDPFGRMGSGAIRWLDIDAPGRRLAAAALPVLFGRDRAWLTQAGYRRGRAEGISLEGGSALVIDGDVISTAPSDKITVGLSPPLRFFVPRSTARSGVRAERVGIEGSVP